MNQNDDGAGIQVLEVEKMKSKVTVIGAGNVGATCAQYIAMKNLADVFLVDVVEGMPQGKALDITQAGLPLGFDARVVGTNDYADTGGSEVVVMTAGLARKPGMSREDLLQANARIVETCIKNAVQYSPDAKIIMVTNPVDVMTYHAYQLCAHPPRMVFGQAGILDSARFAAFIAMELNVSVRDVSAMVLGGHGDSMVPLPRFTTVAGIAVTELIPEQRLQEIMDRTRNGGGEIVALLKSGSAFYAPAAATTNMVEAVLLDARRTFACSVYLNGQYGIHDVYIGSPCVIGAGGVEQIIELELSGDELKALQKSAEIYRETIDLLEK